MWLQVRIGTVAIGDDSLPSPTVADIQQNALCFVMPGPMRAGQVVEAPCTQPLVGRWLTVQNFNPTADHTKRYMAIADVEVYSS